MRRGGGFSGHGAFSGESKIDLDVEPILDCCFRCCDPCDWDFDDMCWPAKMKKPFMSYIDTDTIFIRSISKQLLLVPLNVQYKYMYIFNLFCWCQTSNQNLQKESKLYLITSSCYFPLWNRLPGFNNTNINLLLDQVQVVMKCLSILVVFVGRRHNWLWWWWWWWHGNVFLNWGWSWILISASCNLPLLGPEFSTDFLEQKKTTDQHKEQGKDKGKS